jgi:hypothetical protein
MACRELSREIECDMKEIKHDIHILEQKSRGKFWYYANSDSSDQKHSIDDTETKILEWLSTLQPQTKHHEVCSRRLPDTGEWLLEREEFRSGCNEAQSKNVLWCHGIPGAGKTVLTSGNSTLTEPN